MKDLLYNLFLNNFKKPLSIDEIYEILNLNGQEDFSKLAVYLNQLEDEFVICHNNQGLFAPLSYFNLKVGTMDIKNGGYGFVDTETDKTGIFVPAVALKGAVTNDLVLIKVKKDAKGRLEGTVERIIKRGNEYISGRLIRYQGKSAVTSIDNKIKLIVFIDPAKLNGAKIHQFVKVKITRYYKDQTALGEVVKILGESYTPGADLLTMAISKNFETEFSNETLKEADAIPDEIKLADYPQRVDLTNKKIITIDGDDSKDYDDAVTIEKLDNGNYMLGVYIADVSEYVKDGSELDKTAYERGTSVYLPDRCIPMLPEKLSNGICSLNEGEARLVMACEMEIDEFGEVVKNNIFEGIIKSCHRMRYSVVNKIFEGDAEEISKYQDIYDMLLLGNNLAKILNNKRIKRGAFEFESNEAKIKLNELGLVEKVEVYIRKDAEKMIEEFMLVANETVAECMKWLDVPFIYRVHEDVKEEKMTSLAISLANFGYNLKVRNKNLRTQQLQHILHENDLSEVGLSEEEKTKRIIINDLLIKSMSKAKYQESNIGHFGLASKCYTHFTSPIRRYPDLVVHRLIKQFMLGIDQINGKNAISYFNSFVNLASKQASTQERNAESLERDAVNYKECEYLERFIGKTFNGTIGSITNYGMYVKLDNTIEGLVRYSELRDDYYVFDEVKQRVYGQRNHVIYKLGARVIVRVMYVNKDERVIEFRMIGKERVHEASK